jgi:hypothetical protein
VVIAGGYGGCGNFLKQDNNEIDSFFTKDFSVAFGAL